MLNSNEPIENTTILNDLIPLSKWNNYYAFPSVSAIRQYVFRAETNGFNKVIRRIGRKIYIKVSEFSKWIEENNGGKKDEWEKFK